jgi:hypothetical protein
MTTSFQPLPTASKRPAFSRDSARKHETTLKTNPAALRAKSKKNASKASAKKIALPDRLPAPSKDYLLDCEAGRRCARELLTDIAGRETDDRDLICAMVFVMIEHRYHKRAKDILAGFMFEIADRLPHR